MRKIIIALIASTGVLSGCSDFLGTDPDNRTYIDTPEKVSALLVSAYPSSTFYSVVDARCDGFVDYGTAIAGVAAFATESVIENVANNVSISFGAPLPRNNHLRILPFVHDNVIFHILGSFQRREDTINGITPDIVISFVILGKIRVVKLDLIRLIRVSCPVIDR